MKPKLQAILGPLVFALPLATAIQAYTPASAQAPAQAQTTTPQQLAPKPCSDTEGRRNNPSGPRTEGNGQTLSEKLDNSNGVLCPPSEVDPGITVTPPNVGKTPVIPPPGSPGGDPTVQPK